MVKQLVNRYWWLIPIVVVLVSGVVAVRVLDSEAEPAAAAIQDCAAEAPDDYACWRDRFRTLVAEESPQAALDDARAAYDSVPFIASQCHQFAHEIGRAAGDRYGDVAEAYSRGDDFCASGYYHGVIEEIAEQMGVENLLDDVESVCAGPKEDKAYGLAHYNCVHGLGHGLMAVTNVELYESLEGCDAYTDSWERESCYGGVFMENIMARNSPHHTTRYLRDDDPLYPCTEVDDIYLNQCYTMQTSHALTVVGFDYAQVFDLCLDPAVEPYQAACLESLGRDVSGNNTALLEGTLDLCMSGPNEFAQQHCIIGAAKDFVYHYHNDAEGLALCEAVENPDISAVCRDTVITFWGNM